MDGFLNQSVGADTKLSVNVACNLEDLKQTLEVAKQLEALPFVNVSEFVIPLSSELFSSAEASEHAERKHIKKLKKATGFEGLPTAELTANGFFVSSSEELKDFLAKNKIASSPSFFILTDRRVFVLEGYSEFRKLKEGLILIASKVKEKQLPASSKVIAKSSYDRRIGKLSPLKKPLEKLDQYIIAKSTKALVEEKKTSARRNKRHKISYSKPPICQRDNRRRREIAGFTPGLAAVDVLVFDPADSWQATRAAKWKAGPTYPFPTDNHQKERLLKENPKRSAVPILQVQCLPTRYHVYNENGKGFIEFTEGKRLVETVR